MRLHSYIVTHDTGFSPNPFWGFCTLADCKPTIRRTAAIGDWIVGLSPKAHGNKLVYAMTVEEILPYDQYFGDKRFAEKKPDYTKGTTVHKCGDNIYSPLSNGDFQQLQSMHSDGTLENQANKSHDLRGRNVLVSKTFYYFGSHALDLPETLNELRVGRGHKNRFPPEIVSSFVDFISRQTPGVNAPPRNWPHDDDSWEAHWS